MVWLIVNIGFVEFIERFLKFLMLVARVVGNSFEIFFVQTAIDGHFLGLSMY